MLTGAPWSTWASDDPKDQARRDVDLVLQAEVKADWEERAVRELVRDQLDQYEEDDEDEDDEGDADLDDDEAGGENFED